VEFRILSTGGHPSKEYSEKEGGVIFTEKEKRDLFWEKKALEGKVRHYRRGKKEAFLIFL